MNFANENKNNSSKKYIFLLVVLSFMVIFLQGFYNYNRRTKIPSEKWSKEVLITKGKVSTSTSILSLKDKCIIVSNDEDSLVLSSADKLGRKIEDKVLKINKKYLSDLSIIKEGKNLAIYFLQYEGDKKFIVKETLSNDSKEVKEEKFNGDKILKIDDNTILTITDTLVKILYTKEDESIETTTVDIKCNPSLISASKGNKGYIVTYFAEEQFFRYFMIQNGKASDIKQIATMSKGSNVIYNSIASAYDEKYGYIFYKPIIKGADELPRFIKFSLENGNFTNEQSFKVNGSNLISDVYVVSSGESAKFISKTSSYGKRKSLNNFLEFEIKDGKVISSSNITRSYKMPVYPSYSKDMFCYADYIENDISGVYVSSASSDFKAANNNIRKGEIINTLKDTLADILYSLSFTVIFGVAWLVPGAIIFGISSMLNYKINNDNKKKIYYTVYLIAAFLKGYIIHSMVYLKHRYYINGFLQSEWAGLILCFIISFASLKFGYSLYDKDKEEMPIKSFCIAFIIDTIITQLLFVPFMV